MRKMTIVLLLLVFTLGQSASAQIDNSAVITFLSRYFNLISLGQYASAYSTVQTEQTFYDYVAGFENTDSLQPYFGTVQANGNELRVPMTLVSFQHDDSIQTFFGCIFLQADASSYNIVGNNLQDMGFTSNISIFSVVNALDNLNCYGQASIFPNEATRGSGEAGSILNQYFDSINHHNYDAAYGMWLYPLPGPKPNGAPASDHRPMYSTFSEGYASTQYIVVYQASLNEYQFTGASAGHSYIDGLQPIVLVSQLSTGQIDTYSGCYAMGRFTDSRMGIINGDLTLLTHDAPTANQIIDALTIDCTTLGIVA